VFFLRQQKDSTGHDGVFPFVGTIPDPLPRLQLVQEFDVRPTRDGVFKMLRDPGFDPRKKVILESQPDPRPAQQVNPTSPGTARVTASSTDWLDIEADLSEAAILLVTDAYSESWRAVPLEPGPQTKYNLMPANYALRAIPLAAGRHHFRVEYVLAGFFVGKWITFVSIAAWIVAFLANSTRWKRI
jgi:hypothetical protein